MYSSPPSSIAINHDDYHAEHIGRTSDGRQFFLTTPFVPALGDQLGREFVALFIFDDDGNLIESEIDDLGLRSALDANERVILLEQRLRQLGDISFEHIEVKPFSVKKFGISFGLIVRIPEDDSDVWAVELLPGNYMAFFEPWDSGEYDT